MIRKAAAVTAFVAAILINTAAQANADDETEEPERDSTAEAICVADSLGQTPGQIAEAINQGDARWNLPRAWQKTWTTLIVEGCGE